MWVLHCAAAHYLRTGNLLILHSGLRPSWGLPVLVPPCLWDMSEYRLQLRKQGRA
jgi:hypothetical protein